MCLNLHNIMLAMTRAIFTLSTTATKSLLFENGETHKKESADCCFDAKIGCFDEVEICELVGLSV